MDKEKYIIYSDGTFDVFPLDKVHSSVARQSGKTPVAAGFIKELGDQKWCGGESLTLGLQSRGEEDEAIIFKNNEDNT